MERVEIPQISTREALQAVVLLMIPATLAVIYYFTSLSFQQSLVLDHTNPRLHNFWTNTLVHDHRPGDGHLIGNIIGYLILVFPCWSLQIYGGQERRFWAGLAIILAIGPFIISACSYIVFYEILGVEIVNDRGFSGVVSALAGFLLTSILYTFAQKQEESVAMLSMGLYFGSMMLGLGVLTERFLALGVGVLIFIGILAATRTEYVAPVTELSEWARENGGMGQVVVISILVSVLGFAMSFPPDITAGSGLTNVVAHGSGILFGMAVAGGLQYRKRRFSAEDSTANLH